LLVWIFSEYSRVNISLAFEPLEICWVSLSSQIAASYTIAVAQLHLKSETAS
jgi:hypothetical protein